MCNPMVSVVVATYRRDNALRNALISLQTQTYGNYEVVLVDDNGSEEWNNKVKNIVKEFENLNIRLIVNNPNQGSAKTRNIGIEAAKGEYITFLDDDDIYLPEKIEKQINYISVSNADVCLTDLCLYDENEKLVDKRNRNYIKATDKKSLLSYHLMYHMTGTDTLMFKSKFLKMIGGFPPIDIGDEFYLVLKSIENNCKLVYLPGCEVKAYVHSENGGLSTGENKIKGENALYEKKKSFFSELDGSAIKFIKMRHHAVLAVANKKIGNYCVMFMELIKSFFSTPTGFVKLFISHKGR